MTRLSGWTVAGILLAMLIGTIHAYVMQLLEQRSVVSKLFPRDWFDGTA